MIHECGRRLYFFVSLLLSHAVESAFDAHTIVNSVLHIATIHHELSRGRVILTQHLDFLPVGHHRFFVFGLLLGRHVIHGCCLVHLGDEIAEVVVVMILERLMYRSRSTLEAHVFGNFFDRVGFRRLFASLGMLTAFNTGVDE